MNDDDPTICRRESKSRATECGWHLLSPRLLEKARTRVRLIAWLMCGIMGIGAFIDFGYFLIVQGDIDPALVGSSILLVAISAALLFASYSSRISHVAVLHMAFFTR